MKMKRPEGMAAVITGGARGIGHGITRRYGKEGAAAVIADVPPEEGRRAAMEISTGDVRRRRPEHGKHAGCA